ncbi:MAG TPA: hypothetical protein VNX40_12950, partial [Mucilaginibacter sp.]|nr:hypothetical protein [Mucilaginibacter sp.]
KLTYQNGLLTQLSDPNGLGVTNYAYDNNGNCVKELFIEYSGGQPDGYRFPLTHSTFDTHTSLQTAFPLWIYFQCFSSGKDRAFTTTSSKNNPLASNDSGSAFTYNYSYNIFGYPSTIAFEDNSWIYKYTPVN